MTALRLPLFTVILVASAACAEDVDSVDVRTDGIYARFDVRAEGDGKTEVTAALLVGGARSDTYLNLIDGDQLYAHLGGEEKEMREKSSALGTVIYGAEFDGEAPETYRVEFLRTAHSEEEEACRGGDAPFSYGTLPMPFEIEIDAPADFSRDADDLTVTWSPSGFGDSMSLAVRGPCIRDFTTDVGDSGSRTVPAGSLEFTGETAEGCELTVSVDRSRTGEIDENFGEGGVFRAVQARSTSLVSVP